MDTWTPKKSPLRVADAAIVGRGCVKPRKKKLFNFILRQKKRLLTWAVVEWLVVQMAVESYSRFACGLLRLLRGWCVVGVNVEYVVGVVRHGVWFLKK